MTTTSDSLKTMSTKALNTTETYLTKSMSLFGNNYVKNFALVLLLLYGSSAAPKLSKQVESILQNYAIKLIYVFILAYLLSGSIRVSVVTAIIIVLGIFIIKKFNEEHFEGNVEGHIVNKNEKQIPTEPEINRLELTKSGCNAGDIEANSIDNITEYNAMANHEDTLHPQYLKNMKSVETDTTVDGYDESSSLNSAF